MLTGKIYTVLRIKTLIDFFSKTPPVLRKTPPHKNLKNSKSGSFEKTGLKNLKFTWVKFFYEK